MITRKLLAALVGISLAAGTLGAASAQTAAPQSVAPADAAVTGTAAAPTATAKAPAHKIGRRHQMSAKTHRKHLSSMTIAGRKVASKASGKRIRVSHAAKQTTTKRV